MSDSGNVLKSNFIQFSKEDIRVIDSSALVAKRLEGFTGVFKERSDALEEGAAGGTEDETSSAIDELTDDGGYGEDGSFEPMSFEDTPAEPEEVIPENVKAQCEAMISEAQAEAEQILAQAVAEAEAIKEKAREEGLSLGREAAMTELEQGKDELAAELLRMHKEYEELALDLEPKMVEVITGVYEHVFGLGFYSRRDVMICLINKALMNMNPDERIVIHVAVEDYDMLIGMKNSLVEKTALREEPEIVQRDDFEPGTVKIETPFGIVDCSIDTELKELARTLKVLSYEGREKE